MCLSLMVKKFENWMKIDWVTNQRIASENVQHVETSVASHCKQFERPIGMSIASKLLATCRA